MVEMRIKRFKIFLPLILQLLISCDFSSIIQKEILEAQSYISAQKYLRAAKVYENILKKNPPSDLKVKIFYQLGELYSIHLGDWKSANKYFSLIQNETDDPRWLVEAQEKMADVNFNFINDYRSALKNYTALVNFTPKLEKRDYYRFQQGLSFFNLAEYDKAKEVFKAIGQEVSNEFYKDSFYYLGLCEYQEKEWQRAIDYWMEFLKREDRQEEIVSTKFLIANAYETMEKLKEAYGIYYGLLGQYPNSEVVRNRLKSLYSRQVARKR